MSIRLQQSRHALGSQATLTLIAQDNQTVEELFSKLWRLIEDFEQRFSRFRVTSELSSVNAHAGKKMIVSPQFRKLLRVCKKYYTKTNGLFNPLILPTLQQAGYIGSWPNVTTFQHTLDYRSREQLPSMEQVHISGSQVTIPINGALDFGGIGKGYLLDMLSEYLDTKDTHDYWLSLGGDIICRGTDIDGNPWSVGIQHATQTDKIIGTITNAGGAHIAIATSGITNRAGIKNDKHWHHIIDPRTGEPAETDLLTATVTHPNATAADIFATCVVILGSTAANIFMQRHSITSAYLQTIDARVIIHAEPQGVIT
jgi:thiamine biosynthesis lipoprotein